MIYETERLWFVVNSQGVATLHGQNPVKREICGQTYWHSSMDTIRLRSATKRDRSRWPNPYQTHKDEPLPVKVKLIIAKECLIPGQGWP